MTKEKIKLTVEMDVTIPQAITLKEMFAYWTHLGKIGSSRDVSFFVDGDGNFHPNCKVETSMVLPEVKVSGQGEIKAADGSRIISFDFDPVAWAFRE